MKCIVVGGGPIGLVYASYLGKVADVIVIDRNAANVAAINDRRLRIRLRNKDGFTELPASFAATDQWQRFDADIVMLCVKSHGTELAAAQLAKNWSEKGLLLSPQNGLGNEEA